MLFSFLQLRTNTKNKIFRVPQKLFLFDPDMPEYNNLPACLFEKFYSLLSFCFRILILDLLKTCRSQYKRVIALVKAYLSADTHIESQSCWVITTNFFNNYLAITKA